MHHGRPLHFSDVRTCIVQCGVSVNTHCTMIVRLVRKDEEQEGSQHLVSNILTIVFMFLSVLGA